MTEGAACWDRIPETALAWHRDGRGAVLATVLSTWGSAPRPAGAQMAVSGGLDIAGSVSGGCVEGAVAESALEALDDGAVRRLRFGVAEEDAFAVGLACGGVIEVLVEPVGTAEGVPLGFLESLVERREARIPTVALTPEAEGERRLVGAGETGETGAAVDEALRTDRSGSAEIDGRRWFLGVFNPPLRLFVVGGSHIAQPLAAMAAAVGYETTIIDPREAFASESRFPGAHVLHDWPDEALRGQRPDSRAAVVTLTHDPKIDDPAIVETLRSDAFYLGCLGSARTHAKRLQRLREAGLDAAALERIHAPVGLDLGGRSPAEIAIAILAEITCVLRRGSCSGARGG